MDKGKKVGQPVFINLSSRLTSLDDLISSGEELNHKLSTVEDR